jgi:hypothetical protein
MKKTGPALWRSGVSRPRPAGDFVFGRLLPVHVGGVLLDLSYSPSSPGGRKIWRMEFLQR